MHMPRGDALLGSHFYNRPTLDVTADLIGKVLVHRTRAGIAAGMIVEAEAYIGEDDPACHAAPGPDDAQRAALWPARPRLRLSELRHALPRECGDRSEGAPAAVLIRALAPLDGIPLMPRGDGMANPIHEAELCRGPGNLTRALGITLKENRLDLTSSRLWIEDRGLSLGD